MIVMDRECIFIDGYQDIIKIHKKQIIFAFKGYQISLEGNDMQIVSMSYKDAKIKGILLHMDVIYD